jgi:hypothetical protein
VAAPLTFRWNGAEPLAAAPFQWAIRTVTSPTPDMSDVLWGVAASSATNAWAVGTFLGKGVRRTLTVHCC